MPIQIGSFWCNKADIKIEIGVAIPLEEIKHRMTEIELIFQSEENVICMSQLHLQQAEKVKCLQQSLLYFNRQSTINLIDPIKLSPLGSVVLTLAYGFYNQRSLIEPTCRCVLFHIESDQNKKWQEEARAHGWKPRSEIVSKWELHASSNGWHRPKEKAFSHSQNKSVTIAPKMWSSISVDLLGTATKTPELLHVPVVPPPESELEVTEPVGIADIPPVCGNLLRTSSMLRPPKRIDDLLDSDDDIENELQRIVKMSTKRMSLGAPIAGRKILFPIDEESD